MELASGVRELPGVGERRAKAFQKLGIHTVFDLLNHFPRRYEDRTAFLKIRDLTPGEPACVRAMAAATPASAQIRKGLSVAKVRVFDETGALTVTFFNRKYDIARIRAGKEYIFYGRTEGTGSRMTLLNPDFEEEEKQERLVTGCILPVYPLTEGISAAFMRKAVRAVLPLAEKIPETLPPSLLAGRFTGLTAAYRDMHAPETPERARAARRRLAYDELLALCLKLQVLRRERLCEPGIPLSPVDMAPFYSALPFVLTAAQRRVLDEAAADLASGRPMNRLIQGDVGSGKTAVAAGLMVFAAKNGYQSALMAPTELLARQHAHSLGPLFETLGLRAELLSGSTGKKERKRILDAIGIGQADVLIGTHALLEGDVRFARLSLVVTDEQHRFGVRQRAALSAKGERPHALVLSATPIPRTLSLILFGELDLSVLDELPPGRKPVATYLIDEDKRQRLYDFIRKLVREGRQGYIVCPAIEESEQADLKAAEEHAKHLREEVFPDLKTALLHGKMKPAEKNRAMEAFAAGEIQLLVSTTVIEVGVDVPNAAVMVVENAERFGLSALHQLRGRVGRGAHQSYCILVSGHEGAKSRLEVLMRSHDGFAIAEADLESRGPGDFFGNRQHGLPELRVARLAAELRLLEEAEADAKALLAADPQLARPEHQALKSKLAAETAGSGAVMN